MVEGGRPEVLAQEPFVDLSGRYRGRQREVAAADPLAQADDVGPEVGAGPLRGEQLPGAPEASGHLVADQQHAVLPTGSAHPGQIARVSDQDARGPLDQRLDDHGRQRVGIGGDGGHRLVGPARCGVSGGAYHWEPQRIEHAGAESAVTDRQRPDGVPVIGVAQGEESGVPGLAAVDPVLEGHLEGLLHCHCTVGGEGDVGVVDRDHGR